MNNFLTVHALMHHFAEIAITAVLVVGILGFVVMCLEDERE